MLAMIVGSLLAVLGLLYVLIPLMRGSTAVRPVTVGPDLPPEASALDALREIEFDQATGKLSAEDYSSLRATYTPLAVAEMKAREDGTSGPSAERANAGAASSGGAIGAARPDDAAEALIARIKARGTVCPACGPRPEADAIFCSDCGRYLAAACLRCGAAVGSDQSRFCPECGESLAA